MTVYIAASARDARFTRICVASIRHFHPEAPIRILAGGALQRGLVADLQRRWHDISVAPLPAGDYGWGFVKLEPLFLPRGERFLVLDSDTVLTGPILDVWSGTAAFLVDGERQSAADTKRLYYDWERLRAIDDRARPPQFVFNSGQWFGTSGVLTRGDFAPWIEWTFPRKLRHPEYFMPGDQGVFNYVVNQKALEGLHVERRPIMRWPGHGMQGLDADSVARQAAPALIVHWAGLKSVRQNKLAGADLLQFFERRHFQSLPSAAIRMRLSGARHVIVECLHSLRATAAMAWRRIARQ